ncbi:MinD/ParA family ATP-binding protein [Mycolicibacterium stellerae]|uniref:MinD/ParA family ATP-binding protein n=1 Tax=Mycolicibacterium stellerae TaxID=2358193 RepID=UPI001F3CAAEE|nr:MinD/ParA family protein [Mycolicibacterium stellerae]
MTERDDFLREHLSPPSDSGDEPANRPPEPPRQAGPDDTSTRNGINDGPRHSGPEGDAPRPGEDAVRRPAEPGRPGDDRRPRWTADPGRAHTGPQRIPPGGFRHGPPPRPTDPSAPPAPGGEPGTGARPEGRPREETPAESTRVIPPTGADGRGNTASGRPGSPGWQQEPPRDRSPRPAGQDWSSQSSSSPNWAAAPAAAPPSTGYSYVDSIRTSELVPSKKVPPRKGWRRFIYRGTFGLINLGPSPDEQRLADLELKIRSLLRGHYKIGVFGKGGVGKTTVAASVGSIFAELRQDDRVVAIDADTAFGKLGSRIDPNAAGSYWELAADEHLDTFADVRSRVGNNSAGLFVLAGESSTARRRVLDPAIYREATARLDRHFTISIVDCGSTMDSAIAQEVLRDLDALIVVSSPWVDGASAAGQTMEWLANRGYTGLLHRTVVVLNDSDGHADKRTRSILVQQFASRGQVVVEVPFDSHLRPGGVIDVTSEMSPLTRRRFIEVTAAIAEHFASTTDGPRDRR